MGDDQDRQQDGGKGHPDFDQPRHDRIDPAAEIAGEQAEQRADHRRGGSRRYRHDQRDPRPVDQPREHVAPEVVGAEAMRGIGVGEAERRQARCHQILFERIVRRDPGREHRQDDEQENEEAADHQLGIAKNPPQRREAPRRAPEGCLGRRDGGPRREVGVRHGSHREWSRHAWRSLGLRPTTARSTIRFVRMNSRPKTRTSPWISGRSRLMTASIAMLPRPG